MCRSTRGGLYASKESMGFFIVEMGCYDEIKEYSRVMSGARMDQEQFMQHKYVGEGSTFSSRPQMRAQLSVGRRLSAHAFLSIPVMYTFHCWLCSQCGGSGINYS